MLIMKEWAPSGCGGGRMATTRWSPRLRAVVPAVVAGGEGRWQGVAREGASFVAGIRFASEGA